MDFWIFLPRRINYWFYNLAITQNYARSQQIAIDEITQDNIVTNYEYSEKFNQEEIEENFKGCYVHGVFLDGASWNKTNRIIEESISNFLVYSMPIIHIKPLLKIGISQIKKENQFNHIFYCPVYVTSKRAFVQSESRFSSVLFIRHFM